MHLCGDYKTLDVRVESWADARNAALALLASVILVEARHLDDVLGKLRQRKPLGAFVEVIHELQETANGIRCATRQATPVQ